MTKRYQQRLAEYKRLAKKADAQLRAIERVTRPGREIKYKEVVDKKTGKKTKVQITSKRMASEIERYKHLRDYAYKTATDDIKKLYGSGTRFDRSAYTTKDGKKKYISLDALNARIKAMETFLSKPSAYLRKTKEHSSYADALKRSAKAFSDQLSKQLGRTVKLTPEQIKALKEELKQQGTDGDYGVYEALEAVYEYQNNKAIEEALSKIKGEAKNMTRRERDAVSTELKNEFQEKGIDITKSQTLASMAVSGIDFKQFANI